MDFYASYISGATSIALGSPLDILKTHLQSPTSRLRSQQPLHLHKPLLGTATPILTYGLLNAVLISTYNRTLLVFPTSHFTAGCIAGLAVFPISQPTELIKTRSQISGESSWRTVKSLLSGPRGVRGLLLGGPVTALRDSVGFGVYFAVYEVLKKHTAAWGEHTGVLLAGGIAGCATWASVYPLDVVKTRVQTQELARRKGAWECAKRVYREGGGRAFFGGFAACMARAFVVNAAQWSVYEWLMKEFGGGG